MKDVMYIPILKGKRAEFRAIKELSMQVQRLIVPLIEIEPISIDFDTELPTKTYNEHLNDFGRKLSDCLGETRRIMLDGLLIEEEYISEGDTYPVVNAVSQLRGCGVEVIPVTSPTRSDKYKRLISSVISDSVCLRLTTADLMNPQLLVSYIESLRVGLNKIDVIIDFRASLKQDTIDTFVIMAEGGINNLPNLYDYRSVSVAAGSFPTDLSDIQVGIEEIPRLEWELWKKIKYNGNLKRDVIFSDYSIQHPDFTRIPTKFPSVSASIRYTGEDCILVFRGRDPKKYGYEQYGVHCQRLIAHVEYCGESFSQGDKDIWLYAHGQMLKASKEVTYGSPEVWRRVAANHHITKVIAQLSS